MRFMPFESGSSVHYWRASEGLLEANSWLGGGQAKKAVAERLRAVFPWVCWRLRTAAQNYLFEGDWGIEMTKRADQPSDSQVTFERLVHRNSIRKELGLKCLDVHRLYWRKVGAQKGHTAAFTFSGPRAPFRLSHR
jgi:hypothetical protein